MLNLMVLICIFVNEMGPQHNKNMKKLLFIATIFWAVLFAGKEANAKKHHVKPFALGVRASPNGFGINARFFMKDQVFFEAQHNWSKGTPNGAGRCLMNGLLVNYSIGLSVPNVRMYVGAGGHYGSWVQYKDRSAPADMFGFDWVIGTEAIFPASHFGVSVDFKPAYNFTSGITFMPNCTLGLGIRYYFGRWVRR